jgi:RuvB-like protein 1 (pontin 52)
MKVTASAGAAAGASGSGFTAGPTTSSSVSREARVASHSHIKGLGLADDGTAIQSAHGFVGQKSAREVRTEEIIDW